MSSTGPLSAGRCPSTIAPGTRISFPFSVGHPEMTAFAELSGDRNPIHVDDEFARRNGFSGRVVYGGILVAITSRLIGMRLPTHNVLWTRIALEFRAPLYINEEATLSAEILRVSTAARAARLSLAIATAARVIAAGSAELALLQDG